MLPGVDCSITVPVPVDVAFHAFQNLDRLLRSGPFEEITWTEGVPWQVGSRLRLVATQPVRATVSAVITAISPPRSIDMLNHALGITVEQHVSFGPDLKGGTRIRVMLNLVGKSTEFSESDLHKLATSVTRAALDTMAAECGRLRAGSPPAT